MFDALKVTCDAVSCCLLTQLCQTRALNEEFFTAMVAILPVCPSHVLDETLIIWAISPRSTPAVIFGLWQLTSHLDNFSKLSARGGSRPAEWTHTSSLSGWIYHCGTRARYVDLSESQDHGKIGQVSTDQPRLASIDPGYCCTDRTAQGPGLDAMEIERAQTVLARFWLWIGRVAISLALQVHLTLCQGRADGN